MDPNSDIGQRVRAARIRAGLSRKVVADQLAVGEDAIVQWKLGRRQPNMKRLGQIVEACGVPVEFFFDRRALLDPMAAISAQLSSIEDRLARIEAELGIRRRS